MAASTKSMKLAMFVSERWSLRKTSLQRLDRLAPAPLGAECEHSFVTSQGSIHGQFQRAVGRGNILQATALARELGQLSLSDSFALLLLFADRDVSRFERAAPRWHARLIDAAGDLTLAEAQATLGALALLPGPARLQACELLAAVCREHGVRLQAVS